MTRNAYLEIGSNMKAFVLSFFVNIYVFTDFVCPFVLSSPFMFFRQQMNYMDFVSVSLLLKLNIANQNSIKSN